MSNEISLIAELNRMKVLFQARTIAAVLGMPQPVDLPTPVEPEEETRA